MKTRRNQSGNFRPCARVNLSMALLTARHFIVVLECESLYGCVEEHIRCRYLASVCQKKPFFTIILAIIPRHRKQQPL